ncbi:MAG: outer membrane beta-barrel protein [Nonlabens sp.]
MKFTFTACVIFFCVFNSFAQQFEIKGVIKDSITSENLLSATVFLESVKDSTLITYSITGADGKFNLEGNTGYRLVNFFTSYQGYKEYKRVIDLEKGRILDLGEITLSDDIESLDELLVVARKAPITVKKDTLEFNAKSFNTKADATLEDVINELPGVELDKDGKITVNGKEVSKILVNGKEFFGDDPQIALKNLPKEIIDKIQVTDSKTDQEKSTGQDGDGNASEINITIDEDKNKGWFSRLTAGGGTDDRYSMSGIANYFNKDFKMSVLGSSNNINSPGFSFDEIYDAIGSSAYSITRSSNGSFGINGNSFGGSGGITSSRSAGLNLSNDWGEKLSAQGNYFYGSSNTESATDTRRTTFLPDRIFNTISSRRGINDSDSHRASGEIKIEPDSLLSISIRPSYNFSKSRNISSSDSRATNEDGSVINIVDTESDSESENESFGANYYVSKRFKEKGSYVSIWGDFNANRNDSENNFKSDLIFGPDSNNPDQFQDQLIDSHSDNTSFSITPSGGKRLTETLRLTASYRINVRQQNNRRSVFDRDFTTDNLIFNENLSNDFEVNSLLQRPAVGLRYNKEKFRANVSVGMITQTLESSDALLENSFDKNFTDPYLSAYVSKNFGKFGRLYFNYNNTINVPSVRQLQPVEDRTNPQNIIVGNPDLDASQRHRIYFNLSNYNWESGSGFYSGGNFSYVDNQVASRTLTDEDLVRTTTYVNVDGIYDGYLYSNYGKTWKKDKREIGFNVGINGSTNLNKGFTNGVAFESQTVRFTPDIGFEYSLRDLIDFEAEYSLSANQTWFDIPTIEDQDFVNHTLALDLTTFWPSNVIMGLRGEYNKFGNISGDFDDDSFVLIGSLGYKFAKDKATVKLKAYDILDQVIDTRRTITDDFEQDTSSLVLTRYFMLSFTYKFSKFGGKDPNKNDKTF